MPYILEQLEEICAQYPVEQKWIVVPSKQVGYNIASALTRRDVSWVNLRFTTPLDRALEVGCGNAIDLVTRDQALLLLLACLKESPLLARRLVGDVEFGAGVTSTVFRSIRALRLSRVAEFSGRPKHPLHELNRAYQNRLDAIKKSDERMVFQKALEHPAYGGSEKYWLMDDTRLSPLAARFVGGLSSEIARVGFGPITSGVPQWAAARIVESQPVLAGSVNGASHPENEGTALGHATHFIAADDPASEVAGALRELRRRGIKYGDAEIVFTDYNRYLPLVHSATHDIPTTYASGYPSQLTSVGRTCNAFLLWIESGWKREHLVDLLQVRGIHFPLARVSATRVAEYVLTKRLSSGFGEATEMLSQIGGAQEEAPGQGDLFTQPAETEAVALTRLFDLVNPRSSWKVFVAAVLKFLRRHCKIATNADSIALESIADRIQTLSDMPFDGTVQEFARFVRTVLHDHAIAASVARGDALNVVPVDRAGYAGREYTFFVGLDDETFPSASASSGVNLIEGDGMGWTSTSKSDARWILRRALGRCDGEKYLIARRFDPLEGGKVEATPMLALMQKNAIDSTTKHWRVRIDAQDAMTEAEYLLGIRAGARDHAIKFYPEIFEGLLLDRTLQSFNEYEGGVSSADLGLSNGSRKYSTSALETLAKCPYQFFLKHVLRIKRPLDDQDNTYSWLTPMQRGLLLHDLYYEFTKRIAKLGEQVEYARHKVVMDHLLAGLLEEQQLKIPAKSTAAFLYESRMLKISADIFLRSLVDDPNLNPIGFEWEFGYDKDVVVQLPRDLNLNLRGKIDRIDETEEGYVVWDYKTGVDRYTPGNLLDNGQNLQWLLYGYAFDAAEKREKKTVRGGYWMASEKGGGVKYDDVLPSPEEISGLLLPLVELVESGLFAHVSQVQDGERVPCTFCDYRQVCSKEIIRRSEFGMQPGQSIDAYKLVSNWLTTTLAS